MAVGNALEAQLSVPVHSLRVTAHHPEHFFVTFTQPAHEVKAVRRGSIRVDGACFNIVLWHEHDHATFDSLLLHVRVVIEKVPMHFWTAKKPTIASVSVDGLAADVHIAAEATVAAPLEFDEAPLLQVSCEAVQLDAFSPTLSAAASDLGQFHTATPSPANTMEVQLGAVTGRVRQLEIGEAVARPESRGLFRTTKQPLIGTSPARCPAPPPKTRATSTPTRSSVRQAAIGSSVPVAQRASLRLVRELSLLGPRDKMTEDVARALLHRFDEPLSDSDISVIARLTRLDSEALRVMARMTGPDRAADEATV
ncbi:hypothetical protein D1007_25852 [Hordeum vulgare]|nr:hypothetical protein D1007_25852 [Hordeum vulgare]